MALQRHRALSAIFFNSVGYCLHFISTMIFCKPAV